MFHHLTRTTQTLVIAADVEGVRIPQHSQILNTAKSSTLVYTSRREGVQVRNHRVQVRNAQVRNVQVRRHTKILQIEDQ